MVLGVSANSRFIGLAAIEKEALYDFSTKAYLSKWSSDKAEKMIEAIIAFTKPYGPITSVALVIPSLHHISEETKILLEVFAHYCQRVGIPLFQYTAEEIHKVFQTGKTQKKGLMKALTLLYPALMSTERKELRNKQKYYHKLFEAVAVAAIHSRDKNIIKSPR